MSRPLSYDVKTHPAANRLVSEAIFTCGGCGQKASLNIGNKHNPQKVMNRLKQHGWRGTHWGPRGSIRCPKCLKAKADNDTASELERYVMRTARQAAKVAAEEHGELARTPVALTMHDITLPAPPPPEPAPEQPAAAVPPQEHTAMSSQLRAVTPVTRGDGPPTADARINIRTALDRHFDDKAGVYLDGQSDEKIAAELKVPRKWVTDIREFAYGPLRENPVITEFKSALDAMLADVDAKSAAFKEWEEATRRKLAELVRRADEIARKAGVP